MALDMDKIIYGSIALAIVFLMLSTIIMPYFSTSFRYAQKTCYSAVTCDYDPTTFNTTVIANSTANVCEPTATHFGSTMCLGIATAGGYRFVNQAMLTLVLFLAVLGFAMMYLPKRR